MPPGRGTARGGRRRRAAAAAPVTLAIALAALGFGAADASATTICVPAFGPACPNSGGNVAVADFEQAMSTQESDGKADEIVVAAGTFTEDASFEPAGGSPGTLEPHGSDPLTIVGAGPAATILTSAASGNIYLFNLAFNNTRLITIRDLTARIPASFDDGLGAGFQLAGDTLDNVDIVSRNEGSDAIGSAAEAGNVFRNGEIRGEAGGTIDDGLRAGGAAGGSLLVEDAVVRGASWSLIVSEAGSTLTARRVDVVDSRTYGAIVTRGALSVENSRITTKDGIGIYASSSTDPSTLTADQVTILNDGASHPAIDLEKASGEAGLTATVSNSILRGFSSGYKVNAAAGPGIGVAKLTVRYSNLPKSGTSSGLLDIGTGNIDADPLFAADLSLPVGSPSIDAGDPGAGLAADFLGAPRPADGDGDGVAVRDQGAFERQPPAEPEPPPVAERPDTTSPQTKIVAGPGRGLGGRIAAFRFRSSEPRSTFRCKLDRRKAARCRSPKRYRRLRPGRHVFRVWATDAAGNKDPTPARRRFRVPR
jgi:hypothetical protein